MRFLIISGDNSVISLIHTTMTGYGSFDIADCIATAMEHIESNKEQTYQVIFVDIDLPDGKGLDFLQKLREYEKDFETYSPAVVMTNSRQSAHTMDYFANSKDRFISKPIFRPELLEILKELIHI